VSPDRRREADGAQPGAAEAYGTQRRWVDHLRRWVTLALVAFALNMLWELIQLPRSTQATRASTQACSTWRRPMTPASSWQRR
jgi:hypothetical protein